MHRRPTLPGWPALLLVLSMLLAACSSRHIGSDEPQDASIREFRETHIECPPHFYRMPCQIGPDGRLYQYNPGENDPPKKN
jgi:hypothetical protein